MKKFILVVMSVVLIVFFSGCSKKKKTQDDNDITAPDSDIESVETDESMLDEDVNYPDSVEPDLEEQDIEEQDGAVEPDEIETDDDPEDYDEDTFDRFANVICVAVTGNDNTGDGTVAAPFATIGKAIAVAVDGKEIYVSAGEYNEALTINKDNIKIIGGFNEDFADGGLYSSDMIGAGEENITKIISTEESVVTFDGTLDNFLFEGFVVESTRDTGHASSAITVKSGSPEIAQNTLIGGNPEGSLMGALSGSLSAGLVIGGGSPVIHNNRIIAGEAVDNFTTIGTPTAASIGIVIGEISSIGAESSVNTEIYNNIIIAGHSKDEGTDGGNVGIGVYRNNGDVKIHGNIISAGENKYKARSYGVLLSKNTGIVLYNNIIHGGKSTDLTAGIYFYDSTTAKVFNNTLDCGESTMTTTAVKFSGKYSSPELRNNLLFCVNDDNPVYEFNTNQITPFAPVFENNVIVGGSTGVTIMGTQNSSDSLYKSATNIYLPSKTVADIGFVNYVDGSLYYANDLHLTADSKDIDGNDITTAGSDLSEIFIKDKDGKTRTVPWSAGAYELD
ncbi:MAG TPA: hypothetical protein PLD55_02245 [bacterium]|jgi:hypothetical protein|nr:hypothetical protein [bacterium]HPY14101.1 hypothetical protein [bacterium]HQB10778.1 hypothetical protein [bacterium]HQM83478.1 hypothetical protein [bacterium]